MQFPIPAWCFLVAVAKATYYQFPSLTGPFPVGTTSLELIDYSRNDPLAPSPRPRALMVSLFYPTTTAALAAGNYTVAPAFPPRTAALFDEYIQASTGTAESLITQSFLNVSLASPDFPVLIFGHGFGGTRLLYTAQLEDLASHGWIIVAVDHTYDAIVVEFPDGTLVPTLSADSDGFPGGTVGLVDVRAQDVEFVRKALQNSTILEQIPAFTSCKGPPKLKLDQVGVFGHSLGGATAAQALLNYTACACGANFDGSIFGPPLTVPDDKPFLLVTAYGHNQTNDATWAKFWEELTGFRREFRVNGTIHVSFSDFPIIRDLLGDAFPAAARDAYGTIGGARLIEIETAVMDAFFGFCLKGGSSSELDGLVDGTYPEVSVGS